MTDKSKRVRSRSNGEGKLKYLEENWSQYYFVIYKSHMGCPGTASGPLY
jgi:hypothetical protein